MIMVTIPTMAKEVFDVTGAGDTVVATLALGLASGCSMKDAAVLANYAAGIVVGKVGTASVQCSGAGRRPAFWQFSRRGIDAATKYDWFWTR